MLQIYHARPISTDAQVQKEQAEAEKLAGELNNFEVDASYIAYILVVEDNKINQLLSPR